MLPRISREIIINSPRARVWRILEKHIEHPEISYDDPSPGSIKELHGEALSEQRRGVGTRTRWFYKYRGKPFTWDDVVTGWDPIDWVKWKTTSGWKMEDSFNLRENDHGTQLTYEMSYRLPYGPLGWLYGKLILEPRMRRHLDHVMVRIKRLSEDPFGSNIA